jgi:hypothetical protein
MLVPIAIATLAAASMSDAERQRIRTKMLLGKWRAIIDEIGLQAASEVIASMAPGEAKDAFARTFHHRWMAQGSLFYGPEDRANEYVMELISRWKGKVIPVINILEGPASPGTSIAMSSHARGNLVRQGLSESGAYIDIPHTVMAKITGVRDKGYYLKRKPSSDYKQGLIDLFWLLEPEAPIPFDPEEEPPSFYTDVYLEGMQVQHESPY